MSILIESLNTIDATLQAAVREVIEVNEWTLDDYLKYLDEGGFIYNTHQGPPFVRIEFSKSHRVTGKLMEMPTGQYRWNFNHPVEAEISALFEDILDQ